MTDASGRHPGQSGREAAPPGRPDWYLPAWLDVPGLPAFEVVDTRSAQGRLDPRPKAVAVRDLVLFHGHACDGLLRGVWAMRALCDAAFGTAPLDRSDLLAVSKNSPCLGDVAAYLTGGRARFGTHRLDDALGAGFVVQVLSTGQAWEVREEPGFFPPLIAQWEAAMVGDDLSADGKRELLAVHEEAQWDWVRDALLPTRPADHYHVRELSRPALPPPLLRARRTDTVNRAVPAPSEAASRYDPDLDAPGPATPPVGRWAARYAAGP